MLMQLRAALGSRLHMAEDGTSISYGQWPSKAAWELHRSLPPVDPQISGLMIETEEETFPPVLLTPVADY